MPSENNSNARKLKELQAIRAEIAALKAKAGSAPAPTAVDESAKSLNPMDQLTNLPNTAGRAAGVMGQRVIEATGMGDATSPGFVNPKTATEAVTHPVETGKKLGNALQESIRAALSSKNVKPDAKNASTTGQVAANVLTTVAQPSGILGKGKDVAGNVAEFLADGQQPIKEGMKHAFANPSHLFTAPTKRGVKKLYEKAVEAGEDVAEDLSAKSAEDLFSMVTTGKKSVLQEGAKHLDEVMSGAKADTPLLIKTRKALDEMIGPIKKAIKNGLINPKNGKPYTSSMLKPFLELRSRINPILDKTAPLFRKADKANHAQLGVDALRTVKGILPGLAASGAGKAFKEGAKIVASGNTPSKMALDALERAQKRRKEKKGSK
jgi:hypothetical protein